VQRSSGNIMWLPICLGIRLASVFIIPSDATPMLVRRPSPPVHRESCRSTNPSFLLKRLYCNRNCFTYSAFPTGNLQHMQFTHIYNFYPATTSKLFVTRFYYCSKICDKTNYNVNKSCSVHETNLRIVMFEWIEMQKMISSFPF
jgi:hypothetical protein